MIEYIALAVSAGIFVLVLAGLGLAVVLRSKGAPRLPVLGQKQAATPTSTARNLLDAMTEIAKDAAANKLVEAFIDPANNPHIPAFLVPAKPEGKPAPETAPVPNAP